MKERNRQQQTNNRDGQTKYIYLYMYIFNQNLRWTSTNVIILSSTASQMYFPESEGRSPERTSLRTTSQLSILIRSSDFSSLLFHSHWTGALERETSHSKMRSSPATRMCCSGVPEFPMICTGGSVGAHYKEVVFASPKVCGFETQGLQFTCGYFSHMPLIPAAKQLVSQFTIKSL